MIFKLRISVSISFKILGRYTVQCRKNLKTKWKISLFPQLHIGTSCKSNTVQKIVLILHKNITKI